VVPPVPSNAASDTRMPSTLAWFSFIPVIVQFPPTDFSVAPKENVTRLAAVKVTAAPNETIAGNVKVANVANDAVTAPTTFCKLDKFTEVHDAQEGENTAPSVIKEGRSKFVKEANTGEKAPV